MSQVLILRINTKQVSPVTASSQKKAIIELLVSKMLLF